MPGPLLSYEELTSLALGRVEADDTLRLHQVEVGPVSRHRQPGGVGQLQHDPRLAHLRHLSQGRRLVLLGRVLNKTNSPVVSTGRITLP